MLSPWHDSSRSQPIAIPNILTEGMLLNARNYRKAGTGPSQISPTLLRPLARTLFLLSLRIFPPQSSLFGNVGIPWCEGIEEAHINAKNEKLLRRMLGHTGWEIIDGPAISTSHCASQTAPNTPLRSIGKRRNTAVAKQRWVPPVQLGPDTRIPMSAPHLSIDSPARVTVRMVRAEPAPRQLGRFVSLRRFLIGWYYHGNGPWNTFPAPTQTWRLQRGCLEELHNAETMSLSRHRVH